MRRFVVLALVGMAIAACSGEDVVLATIPSGDGGEAPEHDEKCVSRSECKADKFCDKLGCGTMPGKCHHYPTSCDNTRSPVCGCDGVTYFNDCLRRIAGVSAALAGECETNALECTAGTCPTGALCARLVGTGFDRCDDDLEGRCWVLPPSCPPGDLDHWDTCGSPDPTHLACADTCAAIRSERPSHRQTRCN